MTFDGSKNSKQIEATFAAATGKPPAALKSTKAPRVKPPAGMAYSAKRAPTLSVEQVYITPDMAGSMLTRNSKNRMASAGHVKDFEAIIRDGKWFHGSVITVDKGNQIVDGQHRLTAIVNTGCPVWAVIHRKVDRDEAFNAIDTNGRVRGAADMLVVLRPGTLNHVRHAAVACAMIRGISPFGGKARARDVADFAVQHYDAIQQFMDALPALRFDAPVVAAFCNATLPADTESRRAGGIPTNKVAAMAERLAKGVDVREGDPMFTLRERLSKEKGVKRGKLRGGEVYSLCVGPILAASEGRKLRRIEPATRDFGDFV